MPTETQIKKIRIEALHGCDCSSCGKSNVHTIVFTNTCTSVKELLSVHCPYCKHIYLLDCKIQNGIVIVEAKNE